MIENKNKLRTPKPPIVLKDEGLASRDTVKAKSGKSKAVKKPASKPRNATRSPTEESGYAWEVYSS